MLQNTTKHTKNIYTKYFTNIYCKPIYQHISVVKTYVIMFRLLFEGIFIMLMGFSTLSGDSSPLGLGGSGKLSPLSVKDQIKLKKLTKIKIIKVFL